MSDEQLDLDDVWQRTTTYLRRDDRVTGAQMGFLSMCRLMGFLGETALIGAPSQYAKDVLEQRVQHVVEELLTEVRGEPCRIAVTIDPSLDRDDEQERPRPADLPRETPRGPLRALPDVPDGIVNRNVDNPHAGIADRAPSYVADAPAARFTVVDRDDRLEERYPSETVPDASNYDQTRLNPKYTFDTFVSGASNRFAHAAAQAVAETPARAYNPLFIYGDSGLGKTHLLHAVGHYARNLFPGIRVRYVNSEEFTNDFINSIRDDRSRMFHQRYREVDVLLIDDIQFLQRAEQTMEAFFHTFNSLHNDNRQIVITSDLPPKQLSGFEERMRSRFEWGLLTDIQPPDLETRIAILRKKVSHENLEVPGDVLEYIASRITTNIRELEGALIRVTAYQNLSRQTMDVELAEFVMKDLVTDDGAQEITAADIMATTANFFGLTVDDLIGTARTRQLVTARQIAMYLCRELTDLPLMKIGQAFGGRDHTTVIHANKKISELMKERRPIFNQVSDLTTRLKNQHRA